MKRLTLFLILTMTVGLIYAQEEIQIQNEFESGTVINGYKRGVWKYFDHSGEMVLQINYDAAKVMYIRPTNSTFYIRENGKWTLSHIDKPPMFIGSPNEIDQIVSENVRYPEEALKSIRSGKTIVSFVVNADGLASDYEVVKDFGQGAGEEVIRVLKMIPNLWIPATKNDKVLDTKLYVAVTFEAKGPLKDIPGYPIDPEIPMNSPQLNVAPSVKYFKTFFIQAGNGKGAQAKKT